ncbi:HupE/UreJ family protein [Pseudofulvibacter geojedonensis]|uniref:HupE/UreJ family protein n=1 Tax=Pseudofulvibacter geojedonensis TaxID=1123758 RepID=A0ABW3I5P7_9FLAO
MNEFKYYFELGINHILDINGLDHFFFIIAFCLLYKLSDWKEIIKLITAFTIGHSLTLILAGLNIVSMPMDLIETLIPITIMITCFGNFYFLFKSKEQQKKKGYFYTILFFGLIHGLGFSNFIKNMFFEDESIIIPLLSFNLGIEIAQLLIVFGFLVILSIIHIFIKELKWSRIIINSLILISILNMMLF